MVCLASLFFALLNLNKFVLNCSLMPFLSSQQGLVASLMQFKYTKYFRAAVWRSKHPISEIEIMNLSCEQTSRILLTLYVINTIIF